jgi:hypothetical protein
VLKKGAAGFALREYGEDAHAAAAGVADQDIDGEHALEEVGPVEPMARGGVGLIGTGRGHDGRAEMVVGREDTMIAGEMTARWRMSVARRRRKSIGVNASSVRPSRKGRLRETTTRPDGSSESRVLATGDLAP